MQNPAADNATTEYLKNAFLLIPTSQAPQLQWYERQKDQNVPGPPTPHQEVGSDNERVHIQSVYDIMKKR